MGRKKAKFLTLKTMDGADRIITMGCSAAKICPAIVPVEGGIEHPQGKPIDKVKGIRDVIKNKVERLISDLKMQDSLRLKGGET